MPAYVALLRAVNVGGTGKLPMAELKAICERAGFTQVRTYIASGNVVFVSDSSARMVQVALGDGLVQAMGKPFGIHIRTAQEMAAVVAANPFPDRPRDRVHAIFLDEAPSAATLTKVSKQVNEEIVFGIRELYVWYPNGAGQSRLTIPAASLGTARNMNTCARLAEMAAVSNG